MRSQPIAIDVATRKVLALKRGIFVFVITETHSPAIGTALALTGVNAQMRTTLTFCTSFTVEGPKSGKKCAAMGRTVREILILKD
jgi:hypothetical protein